MCDVVLYLMNNAEITAISTEIGISAALTSFNMSIKSYLYAEVQAPACASACIIQSSSQTIRKAQKYISYRSHLHKYSDHACLNFGENGTTYPAFTVQSHENVFPQLI